MFLQNNNVKTTFHDQLFQLLEDPFRYNFYDGARVIVGAMSDVVERERLARPQAEFGMVGT